jgi:hypothetical protein
MGSSRRTCRAPPRSLRAPTGPGKLTDLCGIDLGVQNNFKNVLCEVSTVARYGLSIKITVRGQQSPSLRQGLV